MNSKQLECFIEVAETLNFSLAAQKLYITQPSVSHQIQSLEDELGVPLFERHKKTVRLTPAGEIFYRDAKEILTRERIAKSRVKNTDSRFNSKIAVGFSANEQEKALLPAFIQAFSRRHPDVYLYFRKFPPKTAVQTLLERKMDVVLFSAADATEQKDLAAETLVQAHFVCLVPAASPLSRQQSVKVADLDGNYLIVPEQSESSPELKQILRYLQSQLPALQLYYCDDIDVTRMLVESGLGIALLPIFEVPATTALQALPIVLPSELNRIPYGIAWHRKNTGLLLRRFIEELVQYLRDEWH